MVQRFFLVPGLKEGHPKIQDDTGFPDGELDTASTDFLGAAVNRDLQLRMATFFLLA